MDGREDSRLLRDVGDEFDSIISDLDPQTPPAPDLRGSEKVSKVNTEEREYKKSLKARESALTGVDDLLISR